MTKKTSFIYDLANYLGRFDFITIASVRMWEMLLVAFVRLDQLPFVTNVQSSQVPAGVAKILGNKGGLQISFKLHNNLLNFINVHLVHGAKRYDKRNEMMSEIIRKMRNQREEIDPDVISDFSFIVGDMNYRLESTYEELIKDIGSVIKRRESLDQLH